MLTVDVPVAGARLRDVRNGFTIPPSLTAKTVLDASMHPAWWANLLTTRPLTFASLSSWDGTVAELLNQLFDPTMTVEDLNWLRSIWEGPLIVKGIQTVEDARRVVDMRRRCDRPVEPRWSPARSRPHAAAHPPGRPQGDRLGRRDLPGHGHHERRRHRRRAGPRRRRLPGRPRLLVRPDGRAANAA